MARVFSTKWSSRVIYFLTVVDFRNVITHDRTFPRTPLPTCYLFYRSVPVTSLKVVNRLNIKNNVKYQINDRRRVVSLEWRD